MHQTSEPFKIKVRYLISPELQQSPEDAAVPPDVGVGGIDGENVSLSGPQD